MTIRSLKNGAISTLRGANTSVAKPTEPSISSATASTTETAVSVVFNPAAIGAAATNFTVISSPDSISASGTSSPINVTGLAGNVSYTFSVKATNAEGDSPSVTSSAVTTANVYGFSQTFTSSGTYTVPVGKTKLGVVLVGGGNAGGTWGSNQATAPSGGNGSKAVAFYDYAVTAGQTFAITIAAAGGQTNFGANIAQASPNVANGPTNFQVGNAGTGGGGGQRGTVNTNAGLGGVGNAGSTINALVAGMTSFRGGGGGGGGGGSGDYRYGQWSRGPGSGGTGGAGASGSTATGTNYGGNGGGAGGGGGTPQVQNFGTSGSAGGVGSGGGGQGGAMNATSGSGGAGGTGLVIVFNQ
jgi:hypothetical protein